ncbi:MAG: hypothetical protein HGA25_01550 [Clostridiales bacterium]|nr:hypothetical protein [Clostridiales bacterium]
MGAKDDKADYDYAEGVELNVYELSTNAHTVVYGMNNQVQLKADVVNENGNFVITIEADKNYSIRLVNKIAKEVENAEFTIEGNDTLIRANSTKKMKVIFA